MEWSCNHMSRAPWLFVWIVQCPLCAHFRRMFVDVLVIKKYQMCSNSFSPWKSVMVNPLSWYLELTYFIPDIISDLPLLLHSCTDLKSILLDFVCSKGIPFTNKYIAISTLWWCLEMWRGDRILMVVFCYSGLLLMALTLWWVYVARRWHLLCWCHLWWLGSI